MASGYSVRQSSSRERVSQAAFKLLLLPHQGRNNTAFMQSHHSDACCRTMERKRVKRDEI